MSDWDDMNAEINAIRAIGKKQSPTTQRKRNKGRKAQKKGASGEKIADAALVEYGVKFIKTVGKHVNLIPIDPRKGIYRVQFIGKLVGDRTGIADGGRSVLVEVKNYSSKTLPYSALEKHQHAALMEHHSLGGLSLLVWVHDGEARVYEYPIDGYVPRSSLKWEAIGDCE
jgi:penicillin-binding protein-related factor A (putative recombinase)